MKRKASASLDAIQAPPCLILALNSGTHAVVSMGVAESGDDVDVSDSITEPTDVDCPSPRNRSSSSMPSETDLAFLEMEYFPKGRGLFGSILTDLINRNIILSCKYCKKWSYLEDEYRKRGSSTGNQRSVSAACIKNGKR